MNASSERRYSRVTCAVALLLAIGAQCASADVVAARTDAAAKSSGGPYRVDTYRIAAGGGASAAGRYQLQGTIAQHEAQAATTSPRYRIEGGFWPATSGGSASALFGNGFEAP